MKTIVLTFDDGLRSHKDFVVPILKENGFTATFFICGGWIGKGNNLTLSEVKEIEEQGFEIGNHFDKHCDLRNVSAKKIINGMSNLNSVFAKSGVECTGSFCLPGFHYNDVVLSVLESCFECRRVRVGCGRHILFDSYQAGGSGPPFPVLTGNLYEIPCSVAGINYNVSNFVQDAERLKEDEVGVFCFHNFTDNEQATTNTSWTQKQFRECVQYLKENKYKTILFKEIGAV